jgi:hypothetical protein
VAGSAGNLGKKIEILARHNHTGTDDRDKTGAFASASNATFGLGAIISSDITANAAADVVTSVGSNSTFSALLGNIDVGAYNANVSNGATNSLAIGAVAVTKGVDVFANAKGRTTTNFDGKVGTVGTAGAGALDVVAVGFATSDAAMQSLSGGVVDIGGGSATATTSPDLTVNFGSPSQVVHVSGNLTITGNQASDADSRARGAGGGGITISDFDSTVSLTPDVTVNIDDTNRVIAGGTITIRAQHGGGANSVSDGTVHSVNGTDNYVEVTALGESQALDHQLSTGATIVYGGSCCSLSSGQAYNVIVRNPTSLYLGNNFNAGSQVSATNDTITFSQDHNFADGQVVYYYDNGTGTIGGLTNGVRYSVNVIDDRTIKLLPLGQSENSRNVSTVDGGSNVVTTTTDHNFGNGLNVVYHAPDPTLNFTNAMVDIGLTGTNAPNFGNSLPLNAPNNNYIYAGRPNPNVSDPNASNAWLAHSFSNGNAVIYRNLDGSNIGLGNGTMYFVHVVDSYRITLHTSYCDAVGGAAGSSCALPDGGDPGNQTDARTAGRNPISLNPGTKNATNIEKRHTLTLAHKSWIPTLTDGTTYIVDTTGGLDADEFRLKTLGGSSVGLSTQITKIGGRNPELGGALNNWTVNLSFSGHRFAHEGINLTSAGSGTDQLRIDLSSGTGGKFSGIGGAATLTNSSAGDLESVASGSGATGGAIRVSDVTAVATATVDTNLNIKSGVSLEAENINIVTRSILNLTATVDGIGGGFASISGAKATATGNNNSKIDIFGAGASVPAPSLTANDALTIQGQTVSDVGALAQSDSGGFAGSDSTDGAASSNFGTEVEIGGNLVADGSMTINAITDAGADAKGESDFGAFGGDADSKADAFVGKGKGINSVTIETNAVLEAATVALTAQYNGTATSDSDSDADCFACDSDADSKSESYGTNSVTLKTMAMITGEQSVILKADQLQTIHAKANARCDCFAGGKSSTANSSANGTSIVTGEMDAFVTTAKLEVYALATGSKVTDKATTGGGFIVFGGGSGNSPNNIKRHIYWESTAIMLGEPNPELEIDAAGNVVTLINVDGTDGQGTSLQDHFDNGTSVGAGTIELDDIIYDTASSVLFQSDEDDFETAANQKMPKSEIWGNAAIFDFQQTWDWVTIINRSLHDMVINDIDVVLPANANTITINVKNVPDGSFNFRKQDVVRDETFDFEIIHSYIPTVIEILNLQNANAPPAENGWDILLNGVIHNPIGSTTIEAARGDIEYAIGFINPNLDSYGAVSHYVNGSDQLIRTNKLYLDASGSIGAHTSPASRTQINVELIESDYTECGHMNESVEGFTGGPPWPYCDPTSEIDPDDLKRRLPTGTYTASEVGDGLFTREIEITADAGGDIVMTVGSERHADATRRASDDFVITFGEIDAGNDIDIFVLDSFDRTGDSGPGGVDVERTDTDVAFATDFGQASWERFFRPDCTPLGLPAGCKTQALGAYETTETAVTGHYLFAKTAENYSGLGDPMGAGDRPTGITPYLTAGHDVSVRHLTSSIITFTGIVNADDDNNTDTGDDGSVILLTNGFINVEERSGNLRVQDISSSGDTVTIWALGRVIDAEDDPQTTPDPFGSFSGSTPTTGTDIRGVDITIYVGLSGGLGVGGVGNDGNYVEIDVDVANAKTGVLNIFDVTSGANTPGIFVAETSFDLRLDTVWTKKDVSMYTIDGSIIDGRTGIGSFTSVDVDFADEVNVLGQNIDLDANDHASNGDTPASIGDPDNDNDVGIDSRRGANGADVSLEADDSIYVTEADATASYDGDGDGVEDADSDEGASAKSELKLVLARAWEGDIRLTVREEIELPEDDDLELLHSGNFQRAEDELLQIPNGTIIARLGSVLLRIGDDVDLHQNSRTLAGTTIDIYGDAIAAALDSSEYDPDYGTDMLLRGDIVAGCVNPGDLTCDPSQAAPVHLTEIWGYTDVDHFQFGTPDGLPTLVSDAATVVNETIGDPGYIRIGSKTRVYGDDDTNVTNADGEDRFKVYYLQDALVTTSPETASVVAGHSLTLDGQAESDTYEIWTTGSRSDSTRNYAINILDTGNEDDGVDEAFVYGVESELNGLNTDTTDDLTDLYPNDDVFLLRRVTCIDTEGTNDVVDDGNGYPVCDDQSAGHEDAKDPAFVALLHGPVDDFRYNGLLDDDSGQNDEVQRVNYDSGLNARLTVLTYGGNDHVYVDDLSVITTVDGGAGFDNFQVGQIFGTKRTAMGIPDPADVQPDDGGNLLPQDTFPELVATTRGWLSPGTHAPLVMHGGTGEDTFTVYSNKAELRLEGDDDNDLFVIRAFALAAVCDTDANGDLTGPNGCDITDVNLTARDTDGKFPISSPKGTDCTGLLASDPVLGGWDQDLRKDNNADGVCNNADANMTPGWLDDIIPLDENEVAVPIIGGGFSTDQPLDIRTGGGDDEVKYNINAPVSVDGGTGIDKLAILGTEFPDDFVITDDNIYGAGLNVRYDAIEIVEIDGLEGDDEFFVLSTAFGVAYRVIGGLGSDTINVAGDVVEDIVTLELEGISGAIDHILTSSGDVDYDGLPTDGIETNVATSELGLVVIDEDDGFSVVREGGLPVAYNPAAPSPFQNIDRYRVWLAAGTYSTGSNPNQTVYVTVSAARSPQEEIDDTLENPLPLVDGPGDTVWLCTAATPDPTLCDDLHEFQRAIEINGQLVSVDNRAVVLTFNADGEANAQYVYMWAVDTVPDTPAAAGGDDDTDPDAIDDRSEGDRVVTINHSVISANPLFNGAAVKNVEVEVRDNDTPGVYVVEIDPVTGSADNRTVVMESTDWSAAGINDYTGVDDAVLITLAKQPEVGDIIYLDVLLEGDVDQSIVLVDVASNPRFDPIAGTIWFDHTNWDDPVQVGIRARRDGVEEEDEVVIVKFLRNETLTVDADDDYIFPNLRSETGFLDVEVIDDDTAGMFTVESNGDTVVVLGGKNDDYTMRLTMRPVADVTVSILSDGTTDVVGIVRHDPTLGDIVVPVVYDVVGIYRESLMFDGFIDAAVGTGETVLTRGNGSDLGNFFLEGFLAGQLIRIEIGGVTVDALITDVSVKTMTIDTALPIADDSYEDVLISRLTRQGIYEGTLEVEIIPAIVGPDPEPKRLRVVLPELSGTNDGGWLSHGFLEGQRVRVCGDDGGGKHCYDAKIALIRGDNLAKDSKLEFTLEFEGSFPWADGATLTDASVTRIAVPVTFTDQDWYQDRTITLAADTFYEVPRTREGVKVFPSRRHVLSRLRGPLAVEGGVTGADRSLVNGVKLPGEVDARLFNIGDQPPESQMIDVLNIFDDARKGVGVGTMTSTRLTGFDMADDLEFLTFDPDNRFGEPVLFPGGISWGQITEVDGQFMTDGGQSSIEVVNLMMGYQNDILDVQGTLDPAPPVQSQGTFTFTPDGDGAGRHTITKGDTWDWKSQGYLIGQTLFVYEFGSGALLGTFLIEDFEDGVNGERNNTLVVSGSGFPTGDNKVRLIAEDPDVVVTAAMTVTNSFESDLYVDIVEVDIAGLDTRQKVLDEGFLEGHLINIVGWEPATWRLFEIEDDGTLRLRGDGLFVLPTVEGDDPEYVQFTPGTTDTMYVQGRHGGLTVVHGGGNRPLRYVGKLATSGATLTRPDGRGWTENGLEVGDFIQIGAEPFTRQILAIGDMSAADLVTYCTPPAGETGFDDCGDGSTLTLSAPLTVPFGADDQVQVHVAQPFVDIVEDELIEIHTDHLVWTGGDWAAAGFEVGQVVYITGYAGGLTVSAIAGDTMYFSGVVLTPTISDPVGPTYFTVEMTVWGHDDALDGGLLIGGDTITVCDPTNPEPCGPVIAGPDSPLVLLGDTTQDGMWYTGHTYDVLGLEFGDKPFDGFVYLPDGDNEDDEWIFPLADPYDYAGNDVIDASNLPGGTNPLWSVGVTMYGGVGDDLLIGSQTGDHIAGGSGNDEIHGGRGPDHIYGDSGVNIDIFTRRLTIPVVDASPRPTIDPSRVRFINNGTTIEPAPSPVKDLLAAGRDLIFGEGDYSAIYLSGPEEHYDDIIFGDHGSIAMYVQDPNEPFELPQRIQTTLIDDVFRIASEELQNGDDDTIFGNLGRDVIVAGAGNDMADGDEQDDLVFGDNVTELARRHGDITSLRFQTLCGGQLYTRTDQALAGACTVAGFGPVTGDNSGQLLVDGTPRDYRDPDSAPWWSEYTIDYTALHDFDVEDEIHSAGTWGHDYLAGGAQHDMIFGQLGNDIVQGDGSIDSAHTTETKFDDPANGTVHYGASRTPEGCVDSDTAGDSPTHGGTCDLVGDLDLIASFDAATDGEDYIEGGGGNDIAFGGLGQDDIVGGSSDFFSLATWFQRPDGADILFGGSGQHTDRNDNGGIDPGVPIPGDRHASDSDTIVGDNGRIIRIVGINGTDVCGTGPTQSGELGVGHGCDDFSDSKYVSYVYDDAYDDSATPEVEGEIVVRGVTLLEYTEGGPDFRPERFGLDTNGPCSTSAPQTQDGCSDIYEYVDDSAVDPFGGHLEQHTYNVLVNGVPTPETWREIFGNDEVHGGLSDDFIYLGGGNDIAFGDADDDETIAGWGNDWASGGVGQDAILGDDGRVFGSRNSDQGWLADGTPCTGSGDGTCYSEPLHGITAFQPTGSCNEVKSVLCGDYLDQYISTPGQVQSAIINIDGDLKKTVDLTPFNLTPNAYGADRPLFDANNSDDVIFGGLGGEILPNYPDEVGQRRNEDPPVGLPRGVAGDFLHAGAGDDAVAGGEAIWNGYTQVWFEGDLWDVDGDGVSEAVRTDWSRPYNSGDLLHFGEDDDAWHDQGPIVNRLGEFALYDEYDPRRTILLNADGTVNKTDDDALVWFMNLYSDEGPTMDGCIDYLPNGTCVATAFKASDGGDAMFGDLGNDWMVGGTGQDTMYGGWGNDLLNADDVMTVVGDGEFGDQKGRKIQPSPNDTPDTHPLYQDRAFGGAGLDVLIGNTGGDRLIDWVGEFNSYIVPFAPFGIATVSRQVPPWLYEFLYALSASQGADPTRSTDVGTDPERNGEPDGELGLITQKDHGLWQTQTGGPSDPQPGNIPGGARDVLRTADFNDGTLGAVAVDSGSFEVVGGTLVVTADSLGLDAAAVWYHDQYLPVYFEIDGRVKLIKPTGGWNANAYVLFDYWGPDDFKFAGLDDSENKLVIGHKDATGWHIVAQSAIPGGVKYDTWYDLLVAINGTNVTVLLGNTEYFSHTFEPRVIDGVTYGLNKGLIGFGSNNSRGTFDNIGLQVLPPILTLDRREDFEDATYVIDPADFAETGTWSNSGGTYDGVAAAPVVATARIDLGYAIDYDAYLELETLAGAATGVVGLVFDYYSDTDFKYAVIDIDADTVELGHYTGVWVADARAAMFLDDLADHQVKVALRGAAVSMYVNGGLIASFGYNAALVDGGFGLLTDGTGSFEEVRVKTNDPDFNEYDPTSEIVSIGDATVTEGDSGNVTVQLLVELDQPAGDTITVDWVTGPGSAGADVDFVLASGTVTFLTGEQSKLIDVDVIGDTLVEADEYFTVQLSNATGGANIDDGLGLVTILDDDAATTPSASVGDESASEGDAGNTIVTVTVTLNLPAPAGGASVDWSLVGGSATVGDDYVDASGTVSFLAGTTSATFQVEIVGDLLDEGNESLTAVLANPSAGIAIGDGSATITIVDDDAPTPPAAALTVLNASVTENDKGGGIWLTITVERTGDLSGVTTADWATGPGTATAGVDYIADSGSLFFDIGQSEDTLRVRIKPDTVPENNETFQIVLTNIVGGTLGSNGTVTIIDNDTAIFATAAPTEDASSIAVSAAEVEVVLVEAVRRWIAGGEEADVLAGITFEFADLPGLKLAETFGSTIVIDIDAAGWGWSLTPGAELGRIDLLSVLLHEVGHVLGHEHTASGLMAGTIEPGVVLGRGVGDDVWAVATRTWSDAVAVAAGEPLNVAVAVVRVDVPDIAAVAGDASVTAARVVLEPFPAPLVAATVDALDVGSVGRTGRPASMPAWQFQLGLVLAALALRRRRVAS